MGGFLVFRYTMVSLVWMHLTLCASLAKKGVEPVVEAAASDDQSPKRRQRKGGKPVFPEDVTAWSDREDSAVPSDGLGDKTDDWALLRNSKTGWFHRAVKVGDDDQWCLACCPRAVVQEHYTRHDTDPCFGGWTTCGHSGCRDS